MHNILVTAKQNQFPSHSLAPSFLDFSFGLSKNFILYFLLLLLVRFHSHLECSAFYKCGFCMRYIFFSLLLVLHLFSLIVVFSVTSNKILIFTLKIKEAKNEANRQNEMKILTQSTQNKKSILRFATNNHEKKYKINEQRKKIVVFPIVPIMEYRNFATRVLWLFHFMLFLCVSSAQYSAVHQKQTVTERKKDEKRKKEREKQKSLGMHTRCPGPQHKTNNNRINKNECDSLCFIVLSSKSKPIQFHLYLFDLKWSKKLKLEAFGCTVGIN